jgi:hypothetical protein
VFFEGFSLDFCRAQGYPHLDWDLAMAGLGRGGQSFAFPTCCYGRTGNQINVNMHVGRVNT